MHSSTHFGLAGRGAELCFRIFPGGPDTGARHEERKGQMKSDW